MTDGANSASDATEVARVVDALRAGQPVIVPTDTVYGLAADPRQPDAVKALFDLKERPDGVPVAVLVATVEQAQRVIEWSSLVDRIAAAHWPGAVTIVGLLKDASLTLGSVGTAGVRLPDHDFLRACAQQFGPIACTSANRHGQPTITNPAELVEALGDEVEVIVDGGLLDGLASTVVDANTEPPQVLRQGAVEVVIGDSA